MSYIVRSQNFSWHEPATAPTYAEALAKAKERGWDACIYVGDTLVAAWSQLYGTKVYSRELAR